ncbi:MAG TPA: heparin lyase I family protein [Prolixibacteraceae bacterium]|nr:heparin lyase I family protein [Prolixibacteraceae bacterium]
MKKTCILGLLLLGLAGSLSAQKKGLVPLPERVDIQSEPAPQQAIIDQAWVGVGIKKPYAIQHDYTLPFQGAPSYRFELQKDDNTLQDYRAGDTKGRAELSYCYAVADDLKPFDAEAYKNIILAKTVYHYGKGHCPQASEMEYRFSVRIPASLSEKVNTIFAQWHGMPERTLLQTPDGEVKKISNQEFATLLERMTFKKDTGFDKIFLKNGNGTIRKDAAGNPRFEIAQEPNGWKVEQGGYPPMAFGFSSGYFYIKANSDRKYLTDKSDRCNADPAKTAVMKPVRSEFKASTIAYKLPIGEFPRDTWVSFTVKVRWSKYGGASETIEKPGRLDVWMSYEKNGATCSENIVKDQEILIGRNDEQGYYFKFGIYRVGNSTEPVVYNLAGYSEKLIKQ